MRQSPKSYFFKGRNFSRIDKNSQIKNTISFKNENTEFENGKIMLSKNFPYLH